MCFTHWDLDGVVSYLVLRWTFPKAVIEYQATTVQNFRNTYTKWLSTHDLEDYDKVFIMDLGIYEDKDLIDYPNVFIIDHHPGHDSSTYTKAKCIIKEYGSACMLAYKAFKKIYKIKLTREQLHLLILADDFDSYKLEHKESAQLNTVFWDTNNKFEAFSRSFGAGFQGFDIKQENIIKLHDMKLQQIKDEIEVYAGKASLQGESRYVCSVFATQYINEVADILLNEYNADVALVINPKTDHVSYRRGTDCDVDLSKLAYDLGEGAGHAFSSGSKITENFVLFTKVLKRI